ncbi:MAG TPA: protein kinase, partial [Xanthomonadaceae bacterium]|nr:protein kinase [Xanthomonadaceae bacterium]
MFETVCDFPPAQWEQALRAISDDTELVAEALSLLAAQTASFNRALQPLGELMASLASGELQPGDRLGVWQLAGQLGSGGMGSVFVAERADRLFRQRVAIKLLRDSVAGPAVAERLAAERQILAQLHHPNIARLYDGGTTPGGQPYLVMEYVEGLPLDDYCARHALPLTERLRLFLRVCAAVQAAHQQLVVHCDLKPSNVLVRSDGQPMLLDFGIARSMGEGGATSHGFCTPAYASPELLAGEHVGVAADVFSLGVLLTELLAGRPAGRGPADRGRSVPSPSALAGRASRGAWRDLDAIAARACALDPALRYPSVEALALDIGRHLDRRPVTARGNAIAYRAGRFVRRHWRESALAAALLVSTVAFVLRLDAARTRAEHEARVAREVSDFLADAFSADAAPAADSAGEVTARQILDRARARIAGSGYDPALRARLWLVLGRAYRGLGATAAAERMLREAAAGYLSPGVAQPLQAAEALSELSVLMSNQMRSADAVAAARRVVELRDAGGADRESLADSYNVLGLALLRNAQLRQARGALEKSLALRRQLFGAESMQASAAL